MEEQWTTMLNLPLDLAWNSGRGSINTLHTKFVLTSGFPYVFLKFLLWLPQKTKLLPLFISSNFKKVKKPFLTFSKFELTNNGSNFVFFWVIFLVLEHFVLSVKNNVIEGLWDTILIVHSVLFKFSRYVSKVHTHTHTQFAG